MMHDKEKILDLNKQLQQKHEALTKITLEITNIFTKIGIELKDDNLLNMTNYMRHFISNQIDGKS